MQGSIDFTGLLSGDIIGGGTEVIANPTGTPTENINTIEISDVIYQIVGEGVPTGGSSGQVLVKDSATDYDTSWTTLDASNIPYDNTTSGMTATDVQDAVTELKSNFSQLDGLTVYKNLTPQTSYADFDDGSTLPLISLTSNIDPIQDLHGYDHPWAGGAGKNIFGIKEWLDTNEITYTQNGNSYTINLDNNLYRNKWEFSDTDIATNLKATITIPSGSTAYNVGFVLYNQSGSAVTGRVNGYSNKTGCKIGLDWSSLGQVTITEAILTKSTDSVTPFTPYSNECPISGHTEANVVVSPTTDAEDGTTHTIQFKDGSNPLTVYGGTLDVISGLLTVTDGYIASYNGETLPTTWISDRDVYGEGTTPTTGAEVVYELATPQTYQLTPTQVNSLLGQNYISSDTGNIANVKYLGILNLS